MKKILLSALAVFVLAQYGMCAETTAAPTTAELLQSLKNAVVTDITNTVTTNVNNVKLASYKTQLAQKQQELKEVDESSSFAIVKYFKKARINQKISELEANIEAIEKQETTSSK